MFKATIHKLHKSLRLALSEEMLHQKSQQLIQNFWQSGCTRQATKILEKKQISQPVC